MRVIETERLRLRRLSEEDAAFILRLVNDPDWLRFIGDRRVRTLEDARKYVRDGPIASYERNGFGLYGVERKESPGLIGISGLVKREFLDDVDVGFALLPDFRGKGYAYEASAAVVSYARDSLGLTRLLAITSIDNDPSIRLLEKLGLRFERFIRVPPDGEEVRLFGTPGVPDPGSVSGR